MNLQDMPQDLQKDFISHVREDRTLCPDGFFKRVINSIESNGVEFTSEVYDLKIGLVEALYDLTKK